MVDKEYCIIASNICYSISDWNSIALILATYITVPSVIVAAFKTFSEIKKARIERKHENDQKDREHLLKRIEFTLSQHRRLFDDPDLFYVLSLIDNDDRELLDPITWDKKRKLLTFFEEIALLVNSKQISAEVAYYMFGYYALCARDGDNFKEGIHLDPKYWGLFYKFSSKAESYLENFHAYEIEDLKF